MASRAETTPTGLLAARFTPERVREALLPLAQWDPFPTAADRAGWARLPESLRAARIAAAEEHLGMSWPALPATLFLEYARDGNRTRYEAPHFARRAALVDLVIGEAIEGQGRFLDTIADGIWAICEESFWGVPAHSFSPRFVSDQFRPGPYPTAGLPDTADPVIDLFAAETASLLAWVHYLIGSRLDATLPVVTDRMRRELKSRILEPFMAIDTWWWMGHDPARLVNNWTPWILSNILATALLIEDDAEARAKIVLRAIGGIDLFVDSYHDDGGCDEGASYWNRAGGSLFDCLDVLASASAGELAAYDIPRVQEIARYIYRVHIADEWYVNFADGPAKPHPERSVVYPFGKAIGDEQMMSLGRSLPSEDARRPSIGRLLRELFLEEELSAASNPPLIRDAWLPGIEVLIAREREGSTDGLFLAAKGGHNAESHNHNDIGNFIVALDGRPIIIDAGVGVYTRETFGPNRYSIWTMGSGHHNLPLINGLEQAPGAAFRSREVAASVDGDAAELALDLAGTYPTEAGVRRWRRTMRLERGPAARISLHEDYELADRPRALALHLIVSGAIDTETSGLLRCASAGRPLEVRYDSAIFTPRVEEIAIDDARLAPVWGDRIWRVLLEVRAPQTSGEWTLEMQAADV